MKTQEERDRNRITYYVLAKSREDFVTCLLTENPLETEGLAPYNIEESAWRSKQQAYRCLFAEGKGGLPEANRLFHELSLHTLGDAYCSASRVGMADLMAIGGEDDDDGIDAIEYGEMACHGIHIEVWIPRNTEVWYRVCDVLTPRFNDVRPLLDGYSVGGELTGSHTPGYDPACDPRNIERCDRCQGTGGDAQSICQACGVLDEETGSWSHGPAGPGRRVKPACLWAPHEGDVMAVAEIPDDFLCDLLVTPDQIFDLEGQTVKEMLSELNIQGGFLVTVDGCFSRPLEGD